MQVQAYELPAIKALREALRPFLRHNVPINPGKTYEEPGFVEIQRSYHDEDPWGPCDLIFRWDGIHGITIPDQE